METIVAQSSGDNGYTWSDEYPYPSLAAAIRHAKAWTACCASAEWAIFRPMGRPIVIRAGRIW